MRPLLFLLLAALPLPAADPPTAALKSDDLTLTVFTPDAKSGSYRGTRFDWSGVFSVEFGKHTVFGPWRKANPTDHDSIVGPCEEFGTAAALGYDDAKPGQSFLKIGVGELVRPKGEEKYRRFGTYEFAKHPEWKVTTTVAKATFEQSAAAGGYAYRYTKIVAVQNAEVRIQHVLENTGTKALRTDHYNHNFFNVDGETVGKDYGIEFAFTPKAEVQQERWKELAKLDGKTLALTGPLDKGTLYAELSGFGTEAKDNRLTLKHAASGVSVRVTGDRPLSACHVWAIGSALCPEPHMQLDIAPGKKAAWSWTYEFSKK